VAAQIGQSGGETKGAPMWVVTFGDLMSLLLCFFVLLLSFSELDAQKYKELAGSLANAFGVQRQVPVFQMPKGTTMVSKDFDQSMLETREEETYGPRRYEVTKSLEKGRKRHSEEAKKGEKGSKSLEGSKESKADPADQAERADRADEAGAEGLDDAQEMTESEEDRALSDEELAEVKQLEFELKEMGKSVSVEQGGGQVRLVLSDEPTFQLGKADIQPAMIPVLQKVGEFFQDRPGDVIIAGHTDNLPIRGGPFKSNLELSVARAASVAEFFMERGLVEPNRIATMGFGEYRPVASNEDTEGRSKNRRVEIIWTKPHENPFAEPLEEKS
jgi:chemotaxis protein MotB